MTTTIDQITQLAMNLENWVPSAELPQHYPQFTGPAIKNLFWKREEKVGLSRCYKQVGKRGYVCLPLFGLYLAGLLPEQQNHMTD